MIVVVFQHPISRFMARWILTTPQQDYEKHLHVLYIDQQKRELKYLEEKVENLIKQRRDYEAYYYRPVSAKHLRISKQAENYLSTIWGDN